jgi:biopolymer transport protein TolR
MYVSTQEDPMTVARARKDDPRQLKASAPDLVPIMNLVTILIPFLLLSVTFANLAVVDSTLPAISPIPAPDSNEENLRMMVAITDQGFVVRGNSALLESEPESEVAGQVLRRDGDGVYPFDTLTDLMVRVKAAHPDETRVVLIPEDVVDYDTIVGAMDATRDWTPPGAQVKEQLFPVVSLGSVTE